MAEETLLTAGNQTEGSANSSTGAAGTSAPATNAGAEQPNTETQPQPDQAGKPATETAAEKPQDGVPEKYEYKLPEGYQLNEEVKGQFDSLAKEYGLSNDKAQKLIDLHTNLLKQSQDTLMEHMTAQQQQWLSTTKSDKEIGGAKLKDVSSICTQVIEKLGSPELKAALNETGIGNHPELIRFVYRIGQQMGVKEGSVVASSSGSAVQKSDAQTLFDKSL